jgi:hypothetical protein
VEKHHTPADKAAILDEVAAGHGGPYGASPKSEV